MAKDKVTVKLNLILNSLLGILLKVFLKEKDSLPNHNTFITANFHKVSLMEKEYKRANKSSLLEIL